MARDFTRELRYHGGLPVFTAKTIANVAKEIMNCNVDDTPNPAGGVDTAPVGFQIRDFLGDALAVGVRLSFGVFDDVDLTIPSATATLDTPSEGSILAAAGANIIEVRSDPVDGRFTCELTNIADTPVWVAASAGGFGISNIDCREMDQITFTA